MAVTTVLLHSAPAGEERRLVGYANGTPMYLNGAAPVRRVASGPIVQGGAQRIVGASVQRVAVAAARTQYYQNSASHVRIGSSGCSYGIPLSGRGGYGGLNGEFGKYNGNNGYTGYPGYGLPNSYNQGACNNEGGHGSGYSAPRVRIGSTGCSYGIPQGRGGYGARNFAVLNSEFGKYNGHNGYTGYPGYGLPNNYNQGACNYGGGYGWGNGRGNNCGAYTQPYPAAASRGYSWIPRYGSTSSISRYPH